MCEDNLSSLSPGKKREFLERLQTVGKLADDILNGVAEDIPIVFLLGLTGVGKSTLMNFLLGNSLSVIPGETTEHVLVPDKHSKKIIEVGSGTKSITQVPNMVFDEVNNLFFCDCPGFEDSQGTENDIVNFFTLNKLIERATKTNPISILYVFSVHDLVAGRGTLTRASSNNIMNMFTDENQLGQCLTGVLTKIDAARQTKGGILNAFCDYNKVMRILSSNPSNVFTFPFPSRQSVESSLYGDFEEKELLIQKLKTNNVRNISHRIALNADSIYFLRSLAESSTNIRTLPSKFSAILTSLYRGDDLDGLLRNKADIESYIGNISSIDELLLILRGRKDRSKFEGLIKEIEDFCDLASFISAVAKNSNLTGMELREILFHCGQDIGRLFDDELKKALLLNSHLITIAEKENEISKLKEQVESLGEGEEVEYLKGQVTFLENEAIGLKKSLGEELMEFFGALGELVLSIFSLFAR